MKLLPHSPWSFVLCGLAAVQAQLSVTILHMNDHHSYLEEGDFDLTNADIGPEANFTPNELTVLHGGFPRIVSVLKNYSATEPNLIKLHAGDALVGTELFSFFRGRSDADLMQVACFDGFVLGNHEFDDGDSALATFITRLQNSTSCPDTPVLSANLLPGMSSALLPLQQAGAILPYTIETFGTEQVAVIGITIRQKTLLSSSPDAGTDFLDEIEAATATVQEVTALGINKVIMLTHIGLSRDLEWMVNIPGVDVVVGGDSHTLMADDGDLQPVFNPNEIYPFSVTRASDSATVCVVQAWEYSRLLGKLIVDWDENGNVVSCSGHPIVPFSAVSPGVAAYLEGLGPAFVATPADAEATAIVDVYLSQTAVESARVIAFVPEDICFERIPGQGRSQVCDVEVSAKQGGAACNVVAQAFLDQEMTADVAIQNGGGCRRDIVAGNFTFGNAKALLPFSNTMVTLVLSGAEIKDVLEEALENALVGGSSGAYPYAAGLRYDVDANAMMGNRISGLEVNVRLAGEWMPISETTDYVVVTNSFIAAGRDGYSTFATIPDEEVVNTFKEYSQVFIDYAIEKQILLNPPLETLSTKSFIPLADPTVSPTKAPVDMPAPEDDTKMPTGMPAVAKTDNPSEAPVDAPPSMATYLSFASPGIGLVALFCALMVV